VARPLEIRSVGRLAQRFALVLLALVAILLMSAAALPPAAPAQAARSANANLPPWYEGTAGHDFDLMDLPDSVAVTTTAQSGEDLSLARLPLAKIDASSSVWSNWPGVVNQDGPDPRCVVRLETGDYKGDLLVAGGKVHTFVVVIDPLGIVHWQYEPSIGGAIDHVFSAQPATFDGQACVLMADRDGKRVFAVTMDSAQRVVWQYGKYHDGGTGVDQLEDPFAATQVAPNGNVLIADNLGGNRVIEVDASGYHAGAPNDGYSEKSIVWQYGHAGDAGPVPSPAPGYIYQPRSPERLPNGYTLIGDGAGHQVIVVRDSAYNPTKPNNGYNAGSIVWKYTGDYDAMDPNMVHYFSTGMHAGQILIVDSNTGPGGGRLLWVDRATKQIVDSLNMKTFQRPAWATETTKCSPRWATYDSEGALWIADSDYFWLLRVGNERTGTVTSKPLDCGRPGVDKAFVCLTWKGLTGEPGTSIDVAYRVDDGGWQPCAYRNGLRTFDFKAGTHGKTISYRVTLHSTNREHTPTLDSIVIQSKVATKGGTGGGGGGDKRGGSGNSGSSGVYKYPSTAVGGTGTYGTGSGSGGSGTGSGSGGSGAGTGRTGAGSSASSAAGSLKPPVQSTGSGAPQAVQGYQTEGAQGVSGVPLRAAEGAQAPAPERPGPPVPVLALIGAGVVIAAAFFVPWPFAAAKIRAVVGFDHTRAKFYRPFWPLGK